MKILKRLTRIPRKIIYFFRYLICKALLQFKNFSLRESIIIVSETRSGSTWLMELLNTAPRTVVNWEPLHKTRGVLPKHLIKVGDRPYLPETDRNEEFKQLFLDILQFRKNSAWTTKYCTFYDLLKADRVITKFVRASMLLPWMTQHLDLTTKPIYLLRHPIATAQSQIKYFQNNAEPLPAFEVPDWNNNERFIRHKDFIGSLSTRLERQVALWCVNSLEIIDYPYNEAKWLTVYYEQLVLHPERELARICKELKLDLEFESLPFRQASTTTKLGCYKTDPVKQLEKWKEKLHERELEKIQRIFDHFGVKVYSAYSFLPHVLNELPQ